MASWIFKGSIRLDGVTFYVEAESEEEAREKARAGDYEEYDEMGAETANCEIDAGTIELNE